VWCNGLFSDTLVTLNGQKLTEPVLFLLGQAILPLEGTEELQLFGKLGGEDEPPSFTPYIDLPMHVALGHAVPPILKPTMRRLKLEDPRVVARFTKSYTEALDNAKVAERLQTIWNKAVTWYDATSADNPLSDSQQARYEMIDHQCTLAMLAAERTCRKLYTGAIPWSPEFLRLQQRHSLLQALQRRQRGRQISQYSLRRMARRLQQESILAWSKSKLKRAFVCSRAALQSFKRD
jgi:hypothetical protein